MNGNEKEKTKERLLGRRQELLAVLSGQQRQLKDSQEGGGDVIEVAVGETAITVGVEVAEVSSRELHLVNSALERISTAEYGICESCGKKIPKARLSIIPHATRCAPCQKKAESHTQQSPRRNGLLADIFRDDEVVEESARS